MEFNIKKQSMSYDGDRVYILYQTIDLVEKEIIKIVDKDYLNRERFELSIIKGTYEDGDLDMSDWPDDAVKLLSLSTFMELFEEEIEWKQNGIID